MKTKKERDEAIKSLRRDIRDLRKALAERDDRIHGLLASQEITVTVKPERFCGRCGGDVGRLGFCSFCDGY